MRLLYVTDALAICGGLERVLIDKANWLSEQAGYEIHILTANQGNHPIAYPIAPHIVHTDIAIQFYRQYQYTGINRLLVSRKLRKLFRKRLKNKIETFAPDIIVCIRLDYLTDIVKVKENIPLVFESHSSKIGYHFDESGLIRKWQIKLWQQGVRNVQMTVALTQGDAQEWKTLTSNVCVIPNIVHLNETGRYSNCTNKRAIFVGRLVEQKGLPDLITVWRIVNSRYPDWHLDIYGDGKMDSIPEIKLIVHPSTNNIMEEYINSSMLLMTSVYEPFGLVLPEAMSCGLPVVAFDCLYGPADIIKHKSNGFLVPHRDASLFVDYVCELMESQKLRQDMGVAGVKSVQCYHADRIMPMWKELFENLIRS